MGAEAETIAFAQAVDSHLATVDLRPVARAQVAHPSGTSREIKARVFARDRVFGDDQVGFAGAAGDVAASRAQREILATGRHEAKHLDLTRHRDPRYARPVSASKAEFVQY